MLTQLLTYYSKKNKIKEEHSYFACILFEKRSISYNLKIKKQMHHCLLFRIEISYYIICISLKSVVVFTSFRKDPKDRPCHGIKNVKVGSFLFVIRPTFAECNLFYWKNSSIFILCPLNLLITSRV